MTLEEQVTSALQKVCDPCSIAAHAPLSIIEMGLVRDVSIEDGNVRVRMCVTSPSCTMAPNMVQGAETLLLQIDGVTSVVIDVDPAVFWTPQDMTPDGRAKLAQSRLTSIQRTGVEPQQWRKSVAGGHTPPTG
ncbi:metal-sulfur cluster assembly factor [Mesorhizobium sp. M7A.F.Ca.US.006.01.1.1]|nr:metal-sulfur cluster assembly factor [Mesorhizobium sp. M7A.F.Ca.US.006.01.1.1]